MTPGAACSPSLSTSRAGDSTLLPGQPIPMFSHSCSEKMTPKVPLKSQLMQQQAIFSHDICYSLGAEPDTSLAPDSCQGAGH